MILLILVELFTPNFEFCNHIVVNINLNLHPKSLPDIKDNEIFNEVILYMLENDIKLEQESIEFLN